jgi:hypothetical protein
MMLIPFYSQRLAISRLASDMGPSTAFAKVGLIALLDAFIYGVFFK